MAYIGNTPAENFASFLTETFTVSATASYTLSHAVANENDIRLVINGVVQQPGSGKAYTASGTTLTLTSATVSGDVMYAVYLGRALQTVNPPNASVGSSQVSANLITGQTALTSEPATTDELLISDAGTLKRIDYSLIKPTNTPAFLALGNNTSDLTVANTTVTKVTNITENLDTDGAFANSRFTVPSGKGGTYYVFFNSRYNTATDIENVNMTIWKGGSSGTQIANAQGSSFYYDSFNASSIVQLNAGDYIEAFTYQASGSNKDMSGSPIYTFFGGFKLI